MVDHYKLKTYEIREARNDQMLILADGEMQYYDILRAAFPACRFSRMFEDRLRKYRWGTYLYSTDEALLAAIEKLFNRCKQAVYLFDVLDRTFALDYHSVRTHNGVKRTEIGELTFHAKYRSSSDHAQKLVEHMVAFVGDQPSYACADYLLATPSSTPNRHSLPTILVEELSTRLGIANASNMVRKVRSTRPMKDLGTLQEKSENIRDAFEVVDKTALEGKVVIIVDDLYHSGATLHELATTLQNVGANVEGLVCTKTLNDPV